MLTCLPYPTYTMLLRFSAADMLNSALIDVSSGERVYEISTVLLSSNEDITTSGSGNCASASQPSAREEQRQTLIKDAHGATVVSVTWNGRHPEITILDEEVGGLHNLFGSSTVRFMPKMLLIPTRFDTEYVWTATGDSLTLHDYDSDTIKGTFYQNVIRLPNPLKSKGSSTKFCNAATSPTSYNLLSEASSTCSSLRSSNSSCSLAKSSCTPPETPNSSFIPTHLPGVGGNYLEFSQHPLANNAELILSFLMMEILRRGRFLLTPYTFEKPKKWQFKEARDLVLRRLRRNTI